MDSLSNGNSDATPTSSNGASEFNFEPEEISLPDAITDIASEPNPSEELGLDLDELDFSDSQINDFTLTDELSDSTLVGEVGQDMEELLGDMGLEAADPGLNFADADNLSSASDTWLQPESLEASASSGNMDSLFAEDLAAIVGTDALTQQDNNLPPLEELSDLDGLFEQQPDPLATESPGLEEDLVGFGELGGNIPAEDFSGDIPAEDISAETLVQAG